MKKCTPEKKNPGYACESVAALMESVSVITGWVGGIPNLLLCKP